ncbi:uncharacterized protein (DUF885 family) [Sphingomonas jinjuensis]|uniref:Uncharacterized protein (DUF885 family) n=1 Tax=Sphingomonas jinjuensis TaxID=535907 RepID=A0A840FAS7_9SPHN|nr:DUF885 family protein [Sphingomonas jinjuensis]MBB4153376.1 uncharacterized protein (DUF885 family) [Sphingomonas jinjuensis]
MTTGLNRRHLLAGFAAFTACPAAAQTSVTAILDAAAKLPPTEALKLLAPIDAARLPPTERLDVEAARAGLAIDVRLGQRPTDYALLLQRRLGDAATPDRAIERLDRALATLSARALPLFKKIGHTVGTIGDRYAALFAETDQYFATADQAIAAMLRTLADLRIDTQALLPAVPPYCLDVSVRQLSAEEIAAGKQGYREPPAPGHPGAYIVDLKDLTRRPAWSLPSVVAHELLPGHMVQLGIESAAPPHPLRITYAAAFVEGWATYAETLVASRFTDPRVALGHLHWLIFRAARARIDLGLHHQHWSQDEARARQIEWQGAPVYFASFDTELTRTLREPASRAAEALAWLALADRAPRDPARRRRWHAAVLANGRKRLEQLP